MYQPKFVLLDFLHKKLLFLTTAEIQNVDDGNKERKAEAEAINANKFSNNIGQHFQTAVTDSWPYARIFGGKPKRSLSQ